MSGLLKGRVAVVTGGNRGIGRGIVERFLAEGAVVINLSASGATVDSGSRVARGIRCDVSDEHQVQGAFAQVMASHGRIDVLVNNAGIADPAYLHEMTLEQFRAVVDVNLVGLWLCTREALRVMRPAGAGSIVNIASIAGQSGNPRQGNYAASKAGVVGLTRTAARENAASGIRVNAVAPGLVDTEMTAEIPAEIRQRLVDSIPMGRAGTADEMARAVLFLASDLSAYVTGSTLMASGGRGLGM